MSKARGNARRAGMSGMSNYSFGQERHGEAEVTKPLRSPQASSLDPARRWTGVFAGMWPFKFFFCSL